MSTKLTALESAFCSRVLEFEIPERNYRLRYDFAALDRLRAVGVVEAVVIFCARILERLCAHTFVLRQRSPGNDLQTNLMAIKAASELSHEQWSWYNQLRQMGNDARHANRDFDEFEADLAFLIMIRWVQWFFCEFHQGPKLPGITDSPQSLHSLLPMKSVELLDQLDRADLSAPEFLSSLPLDDHSSWLYFSPVVPNVLIERLIDRKRFDSAQAILDAIQKHFHSVSRFRNDQRTRQLQALIWSNTGRLDEALQYLEHDKAKPSVDSGETFGILAGAYKRLWRQTGRSEDLQKCRDCYEQGWRQSNQSSPYHGINAAYLALLNGELNAACELARSVQRLLEAEGELTNYWDEVTLAEALLYESPKQAVAAYKAAFHRYPAEIRNIEVSHVQACDILRRLGRHPIAFDFELPTKAAEK